MMFQHKILVFAAVAIVTTVALFMRRSGPTRSPTGATSRSAVLATSSLAVVAGALLVVGIVSDTVLRHVIQVAPLIVVLILLWRRTEWGMSAAAPLFTFWLLIMGAIWLFVLGAARILTGKFGPPELALTVVIGVASLLGFAATYRLRANTSVLKRIIAICTFGILQAAAMLLSLPPFLPPS